MNWTLIRKRCIEWGGLIAWAVLLYYMAPFILVRLNHFFGWY